MFSPATNLFSHIANSDTFARVDSLLGDEASMTDHAASDMEGADEDAWQVKEEFHVSALRKELLKKMSSSVTYVQDDDAGNVVFLSGSNII